MSDVEVAIELVKEFRPTSIREAKVNRETKDFIFIDFFIQSYNMQWHKVEGAFIRKAEIRELK